MEPTVLLLLALGATGALGQDTPGQLKCYKCELEAKKDSNCSETDCDGLCGLAKLSTGFVNQTCVTVTSGDDIADICKPEEGSSEVSKVCCGTDFCNGLPVMCAGPRQATASALLLAVCVLVQVLE